MDGAEPVHGGGHQFLGRGLLGDIAVDANEIGAEVIDRLQVGPDDAGALRQQAFGDGQADAGGGSGHHGDLAGEPVLSMRSFASSCTAC